MFEIRIRASVLEEWMKMELRYDDSGTEHKT